MIIGGKPRAGNKGLNTALLATVARYFGAVFEFIFIHPRQRIVPPLARGAVAANMRPPTEGHARPAAGADNDRKYGLRASRCAIHGLRDRKAVSVIRQTHLPVQALA